MENWTIEWVFVIIGIVAVIAVYVKRDKIPGLGGGSKRPGGPKERRK